MENNTDRSSWSMGNLALAGVSISALLALLPKIIDAVGGKIMEVISTFSI